MTSAEREAIARRAIAKSVAQHTEVRLSSSDSALTRFARGISHQNLAATDATITIRAISGHRTGVASGNHFDDASLAQLAARALDMASFAPADPLLAPLPTGDGIGKAPKGAYADATAHADPFVRASAAGAILTAAEDAGYWCSGYVSTAAEGITIANTSGALASFERTDAAVNAKVVGADSSGYAERYTNDSTAIDGETIGRTAVEKTLRSEQPRSVDPGEWTVILEPAAFGELLHYVMSHFSAQAYDEGSSFFSGRLGQRFFSDGVTIRDDYTEPLAPGMPFDYEAQPKQRLSLVEHGVVKNIVTDSYYANKLQVPNTGHALPAPNAYGPQALNVVIAPGTATTDELIASTSRGLLITRFWYIRTVDQKRAIVTGMTRDGTFLIENGRVTGGVRNMRFNQSIVEALAQATFARERRRTGGEASLVVPAAKIEGFRFTSGTEF